MWIDKYLLHYKKFDWIQDGTSELDEKCSNLLVLAYKTLASYQPNLNWKKDLDESENSLKSTYL